MDVVVACRSCGEQREPAVKTAKPEYWFYQWCFECWSRVIKANNEWVDETVAKHLRGVRTWGRGRGTYRP